MTVYSLMSHFIFHTTPGNDWPSSEDSVPRCCWLGIETPFSIPPAPSPTNLPITSSNFSPLWGQETCRESRETQIHVFLFFFFFYTYWHEHDAVISPAKLSDTMQKHSRHLLVSVFNETENFKGKTPHLTLPILEDCCLRIFIAPVWGKKL